MANPLIKGTLGGARALRKVPVARLLALAEVAILVREHIYRLEPQERHRLAELIMQGRGRPSSLSARERRELTSLVAKTEPRGLLNEAVEKVTGVPVSRRRRGRR